MEEIVLQAEERPVSTGSYLTSLRKNKKVPGVVYGDNKENLHIAVQRKDLLSTIHGEAGLNTIISLKVNNSINRVLVHDIQRDILSGEIIHVDFYRIKLTEKIKVKVPIHLVGKAQGQEMGGVVDHIIREIEVECLPTNIPSKFDVDITGLKIGDTCTVNELPVLKEVALIAEPESIVVHVVAADKEEPKPGVVLEEGVAAAEPEVIAKGKEKEKEKEEVGAKEKAGETPPRTPQAAKSKEDKEKEKK